MYELIFDVDDSLFKEHGISINRPRSLGASGYQMEKLQTRGTESKDRARFILCATPDYRVVHSCMNKI